VKVALLSTLVLAQTCSFFKTTCLGYLSQRPTTTCLERDLPLTQELSSGQRLVNGVSYENMKRFVAFHGCFSDVCSRMGRSETASDRIICITFIHSRTFKIHLPTTEPHRGNLLVTNRVGVVFPHDGIQHKVRLFPLLTNPHSIILSCDSAYSDS
jgi:hypothetical protein